jgi:hypothetical protein
MVRELVAERLFGTEPLALGGFGPRAYPEDGSCPADCCRYQPARPRLA